MIEAALRKVFEPMGHTVYNYGMYAEEDFASSPTFRTEFSAPC